MNVPAAQLAHDDAPATALIDPDAHGTGADKPGDGHDAPTGHADTALNPANGQ